MQSKVSFFSVVCAHAERSRVESSTENASQDNPYLVREANSQ